MHYIGMEALRVPGAILYGPALILLTALLGCGFGATAMVALGRSRRVARLALAAALMAAAIALPPVMGMGSALLPSDGAAALPAASLPRHWLVALTVSVAATLLLCALVMLFAGVRIVRQITSETERLRSFSDATFEAIAICDVKGRIIDANAALAEMLQTPRSLLPGMRIQRLFRDFPESVLSEGGRGFTALAAGAPLELLSRRVRTSGGSRVVIAVRELRERVAAEARIMHLARHDSLTDVPNRTFFLERLGADLARMREGGPGFVLMCLDLDRFKAINDTHGHAAGDRVLCEVARRLRSETRQEDFVARLGGDEFVVIKAEDGKPGSPAGMAQRIVQLLSQPYDLGHGIKAGISASVGMAHCPTDAADTEELLRCADVALYNVKHAGRNGVAFYSYAMDESMRARHALEQDIQFAIPRGELELYWQPQRRVRDDSLVGFEALLRWHRPGEGSVAPARLAQAAESTRAIVPIGAWALRTACMEAAGWASPLRISVDVSALQLQQGGFAELVEAVLAESGLEPGRLELDVTEGILIHDEHRARATLEQVKGMGVRVALDDFGIGYASLSAVRTFPFDRLKIDSSVVQDLTTDPSAHAVVRAILNLGQGLHMPVVAEGVESRAQLQALEQAGCPEYQGYLGGLPQPLATYRAMIQRPAKVWS
jgi:diguanylate cyclase (GGDEF)-like protein